MEWAFRIDSSVDTTSIQVPPFVLQPLIENAIWLGIKHLETSGRINIVIEKDHHEVVIKILDNGIGLAKSNEIQNSQLRTRKHIGISLVRTRLRSVGGRLVLQDRADSPGVASIVYLKTSNHA
jgi:sensor histidine kinase YesM